MIRKLLTNPARGLPSTRAVLAATAAVSSPPGPFLGAGGVEGFGGAAAAAAMGTAHCRRHNHRHHERHHHQARRCFGSKSKPPGLDPLEVLKTECMARNLCDGDGGRLPGAHWVFVVSTADRSAPEKPPNLRTVGIERCSSAGIDFVMKASHPAVNALADGQILSFLQMQGKFLPGEKAEQWRGEGRCMRLPLPEVLDLIPHFTITSMVGSRRLAEEHDDDDLALLKKEVSEDRLAMLNKSHTTEVMQRTRVELENGDISMEELDQSISAFRLKPDRVECMLGGPDTVMWDRWEWLRDVDEIGGDEEHFGDLVAWKDPKRLVPH